MLLVYCEILVFSILACSVFGFAKRFFLIVDEIPFEQQR
jgi:ribosomal protein S20